ncbi:hypothetical protein ABIF81_003628 [Bradyrhizobium daqingense]
MYISFERSSVQNMPVLMPSMRPAPIAGIIAGKSIRISSTGRHNRLPSSAANSTLRPCN